MSNYKVLPVSLCGILLLWLVSVLTVYPNITLPGIKDCLYFWTSLLLIKRKLYFNYSTLVTNFDSINFTEPIPVAAMSNAQVLLPRSIAGIAGSNPAGGIDVCLL